MFDARWQKSLLPYYGSEDIKVALALGWKVLGGQRCQAAGGHMIGRLGPPIGRADRQRIIYWGPTGKLARHAGSGTQDESIWSERSMPVSLFDPF